MIHSKAEMMDMVLEQSDGSDPALACSLVHAMSQWIPSQINCIDSESAVNYQETGLSTTYGLFQFTGQQARQSGYAGKLVDLIDARCNVSVGVCVLKNSLAMAGNRAETGLLLYLGRGRAQMIPGILALMPLYQDLIAQRKPSA